MQYLYRAFDESGSLLYVGISGKWSERLHAHEKTSEWMEKADWVKIERYPDRESVSAAEIEAIRTEKPIYNKEHNLKWESTQDHFQKLKFWVYFQTPSDELHAELVKFVEVIIDDMGVDYRRRQARYVAYGFFQAYDYLTRKKDFDCRNCAAIFNNGQFARWAELAEREIESEEDEND